MKEEKIMESKFKHLFFPVPTQLMFWDNEGYIGGIGYDEIIICGCCGSVIDPKEIYDSAPDVIIEPIIISSNWTWLNGSIQESMQDESLNQIEQKFNKALNNFKQEVGTSIEFLNNLSDDVRALEGDENKDDEKDSENSTL